MPRLRATAFAVVRLSPVSMITLMPSAASAFSASGVDALTGSAMANSPASLPSTAMLITVAPSPRRRSPCSFNALRVDAERMQEVCIAENDGLAVDLAGSALAGRRVETPLPCRGRACAPWPHARWRRPADARSPARRSRPAAESPSRQTPQPARSRPPSACLRSACPSCRPPACRSSPSAPALRRS